LVFVPNYFDFLKLRKFLNESEISFAHICEYTDRKESIRDFKGFFFFSFCFLLFFVVQISNRKLHLCCFTRSEDTFFIEAELQVRIFWFVFFFFPFFFQGVEHVIFFGVPSIPRWHNELIALVKSRLRPSANIIVL
jgi:hypothetical protein